MLRITPSKSAQGAKDYFTKGLVHGDYYTQGQELPGCWYGQAAHALGLSGEVTREQFHALCDNRHPVTGERLTQRTKDNRTVGYDFTFSVPKSVTLAHAVTDDHRILDAFEISVQETMAEIEEGMHTRVRKGGQNSDRATGNLAYGMFTHLTTRPVEGIPDPHLHAHCYVFNVTHDSEEDRWKAGQFRQLKKDAPYYQAAFNARMALRLEALGYPIERRRKAWEIEGVTDALVAKFSRRTAEIERAAKEKGITSDAHKSLLGAQTRDHKAEDLTNDELQAAWDGRLSAEERQALAGLRGPPRGGEGGSKKAMDHALSHSFARASVRSDKQLLAEALKVGVGEVSVEEAHAEFRRRRNLLSRKVGMETLCTTREVRAEERAMIRFARKGRGRHEPLNALHWDLQDTELDPEQRAAVQHVFSSTDTVTSVRGAAGVGKTRLMHEVVAGLEASGHSVHVLAPSARASRGALREDGFANADTVAAQLQSPEAQERVKDGVIWIDEAGLLGVRDMNAIFEVASKQNARVLLTGDTRQHAPVDRGDAQRILQEHGGLKAAEVTRIHRQQVATYKEAVAAISKGELGAGFEALDRMGAIKEVEDVTERYEAFAREYADAMGEGSVLAVAPTHAEGHQATEAVRHELKLRGLLGLEECTFLQYRNLNLTEAEQSDPASFRPGDVLHFHQAAKKPSLQLTARAPGGVSLPGGSDGHALHTVWRGFRSGEKLLVTGRDDSGRVIARDSKNRSVIVPLGQPHKFQLYQQRELALAKGDRVRITKNGKALNGKRLDNGTVHQVTGFTRAGDIRLANGAEVERGFGHLSAGFVSTSHSSQGATTDHVFILQSTTSAPAASSEQFYVSASRGRKGVSVYTDSKAELLGAVRRSGERMSATSLLATDAKPSWAQHVREQAVRVNRLALQIRTKLAVAAQKAVGFVARYGRFGGGVGRPINETRGGLTRGREFGFDR